MNEEEKKAVEDLRKTIDYYNSKFKENEKITTVLIDNFDVNNLFILLNLIQNQKAEIEQLKIAGNGIELLLKQKVAEMEKKDKEIKYQKEINKTEQDRHKQTEKSLKGQLQKKDKMIDLMAERLAEDTEWFYSEFDNYTKQDFIDYFTNKVEEDR